MPQNFDNPVQTQMAVAVLDHSLGSDYPSKKITEGRSLSCKRVFVQTENGSVLGIELEPGENAHTIKKKLQIALNVPTEGSSLTFGDQVLNNDLSCIRNDSPLLLTRNHMHRSCSTPCLSPKGKEVEQHDQSNVIEILGCSIPSTTMKQLVKDIIEGIRNGVDPIAVSGGMGGAYYFMDTWGQCVAIVKPTDEEPFAPNNPKGFVGKSLGQPGLKRSVRVGETGFREVAAYLLDHKNFANVPPTMLIKIIHSVFHVNGIECKNKASKNRSEARNKIASLQQFIPHDYDASDHGTSCFPVSAVHRIGILDIRIFNTDRHAGNLLVRKLNTGAGKFEAQTELIPIDHGLCLPESLEDPYFEWIHWPQASIPFSEEELEYIANLDPVKDAEMLRIELPMIHEASLRVLVLSTIFLKEAAAYGLCLSEIGKMMSRQFTGKEEEPSELEVLCMEARSWVEERGLILPECDFEEEDYDVEFTQFDLDSEDDSATFETSLFDKFGSMVVNCRNALSKLAEGNENEDEDEEDKNEVSQEDASTCTSPVPKWTPSASKLSVSLKGLCFSGSSKCHSGIPMNRVSTKTDYSYSGYHSDYQSGGRSANEMLPPSSSFVKLSDLSANEWSAFLEKFQELLPIMFHDRKQTAARGPWVTQRLGTSCQF
ncbi:phosphatidylinositol 4-kinase gamma 5-like [Phragmites australis]|uniref:phosphatidylinositol 4-kinase gamma 5-like n=1 Tax=Phragmites australis TaxID=29695 RepID=UPI002D7A226B|nr:phosphatidylinositol 4-kinase gamma 5-like [Phragmites australis]